MKRMDIGARERMQLQGFKVSVLIMDTIAVYKEVIHEMQLLVCMPLYNIVAAFCATRLFQSVYSQQAIQ